MKFFVSIFILVLVASGVSPCGDNLIFISAHHSELETDHCSVEKDKDTCCAKDDHSEKEKEAPCSDGCNCYCCAHPVIPIQLAALPLAVEEIQERTPDPDTPYIRDVSYLIWRPPQRS